MERVSVVVPYSPSYSPVEFRQRAVRSIKDQTVPTEPIVVTDRNQRGPAWARNIGLSRSETRYVAFCDADDYWAEQKLRRQLAKIEQTEASLCLTQTVSESTGETNVREFNSAVEFARDVVLGHTSSFISSALVDTEKSDARFDEEMLRREEYLYALQVAAADGVCFVPEPLTRIHKHDQGLSNEQLDITDKLKSDQQFFNQATDIFPTLSEYESEFWRRQYHNAGRRYYFNGDYDQSIKYLKASLSNSFHHRTFGALLVSYLHRLLSK